MLNSVFFFPLTTYRVHIKPVNVAAKWKKPEECHGLKFDVRKYAKIPNQRQVCTK